MQYQTDVDSDFHMYFQKMETLGIKIVHMLHED